MLCNITAHLLDTGTTESCNEIICDYFAETLIKNLHDSQVLLYLEDWQSQKFTDFLLRISV